MLGGFHRQLEFVGNAVQFVQQRVVIRETCEHPAGKHACDRAGVGGLVSVGVLLLVQDVQLAFAGLEERRHSAVRDMDVLGQHVVTRLEETPLVEVSNDNDELAELATFRDRTELGSGFAEFVVVQPFGELYEGSFGDVGHVPNI